jgi:hypothetical protein
MFKQQCNFNFYPRKLTGIYGIGKVLCQGSVNREPFSRARVAKSIPPANSGGSVCLTKSTAFSRIEKVCLKNRS